MTAAEQPDFDRTLREFLKEERAEILIRKGDIAERYGREVAALRAVILIDGKAVAAGEDEELQEAIAMAAEDLEYARAMTHAPRGSAPRLAEHHPMYTPSPLTPNRRWSTAYKNELPDDAFLYVRKDCVEYTDEQGRSHPLDCRELPVKNRQGNYDKAHVKNAISRAPQLKDVPETVKRQLQKKAQRIYEREFGRS